MKDNQGTFTEAAHEHWMAIAPENRAKLLANVWCAHCGQGTTIVDYGGAFEPDVLVLRGKCAKCGGQVARVLEGA